MYVDVSINGKPTRAMVDTGATHNFISDREAKRLGLKLVKDSSRMDESGEFRGPPHCRVGERRAN